MIDIDTLKGAALGERPVIGIAVGDQQVWPSGPEPFVGEWPGANGDPWPAVWDISGNGTATQNGAGAGLLTTANVLNASAFASPSGFEHADVDVLVRAGIGGEGQMRLVARWDGGTTSANPTNGLIWVWRYGLNFAVFSVVGGTATQILNIGSPPSAPRWLRFQVQGTSVRCKWWAPGDPEPEPWGAQTTQSAVTAAGRVAVQSLRSGFAAATVTVSDFVATPLTA